MEEKRRNLRWEMNRAVRFRIEDDPREYETTSSDISVGGVCLRSLKDFAPDTPLELSIEIPDSAKNIFVRGKVAWNGRQKEGDSDIKTGVSFLDLRPLDAERIFKYAFKYQHDKLMKHWWDGL